MKFIYLTTLLLLTFTYVKRVCADVDVYYNFAVDGAEAVKNRNSPDGKPFLYNR